MSQRNPMNERYTTDERQGKTRKSAASMKPKTKAAASVHVQSTVKTKQQKKAEQKAQRAKQAELDRKYYNPPTAEYKRLRKIWWGCLIGAILCTVLSWVGRSWQPEFISYVALGLAYVLIIAAFYIDFSKIRKVRRAYQAEMTAKKSKEVRALEKQQKAAAREAAAQKGEEEPAEQPKKRGLFAAGSGFPRTSPPRTRARRVRLPRARGRRRMRMRRAAAPRTSGPRSARRTPPRRRARRARRANRKGSRRLQGKRRRAGLRRCGGVAPPAGAVACGCGRGVAGLRCGVTRSASTGQVGHGKRLRCACRAAGATEVGFMVFRIYVEKKPVSTSRRSSFSPNWAFLPRRVFRP